LILTLFVVALIVLAIALTAYLVWYTWPLAVFCALLVLLSWAKSKELQ
jgi:hypothetical protein